MKVCPNCNQSYADDSLNFCLNDGATLTHLKTDEPPPTILMNSARTTSPNFSEQQPTNFTNQPNFGVNAPLSSWQDPQMQGQNQPQYMSPQMSAVQGQNQTLPTISLVLGILSILLFCCFGGLPLGIGALATGYIGYSNANKDPMQYGGKGLAMAGMIMGGIMVVSSILWLLISVVANVGK